MHVLLCNNNIGMVYSYMLLPRRRLLHWSTSKLLDIRNGILLLRSFPRKDISP